MNITKIKVNLTGEDLLSIYSEFVSVEGLEVKNIEISDGVNITGRLNKGFNIDFLVNLKFESYENNIIKIEITKIKVLSIGILKFIKNMAIKYLLKSFKEKGITYNKGKVEIEYKYVLKDVPYVDFDIENIFCYLGCVNVEVSNVQVSTAGLIKKDVQLIDRSIKKDVYQEEEIKKVEDCYTVGREKIKEKMPIKIKKYSDYILIIPDIVALIYRLLKDKRVPIKTKVIISLVICYMAVPSDIIPDKIPFIGKIDDIAMVFFALNKIIEDVPAKVILENWDGKNNIVTVLKIVAQYVTDFTGAKNVETIYGIIDEIVSI